MNRTEFEAIRNLEGKTITEDIRFSRRAATSPFVVAENIVITCAASEGLRLNISYNPATGATTFNVHERGLGPICRLDVGGPRHPPAGRGHKHSLQTERCPDRNLPDDVVDRPDLLGKPFTELFEVFCLLASIAHTGSLEDPSAAS